MRSGHRVDATRATLVLILALAGCGGEDLDAIKEERGEDLDIPALEEVLCLLDCQTCDWPQSSDLYVTERLVTLEGSPVGRQNGCSFGAVGPYEAWAAWHCVKGLADTPERIALVPGYVLGEPVCDDRKTVLSAVQVGADKALLTVSEPFTYYAPPCGPVQITGKEVEVQGYPVNYDGGEVPQRLLTRATSETRVIGDFGGGGSGSPVLLDGCTTGVLVTIESETTLGVQRKFMQVWRIAR